MNLPAIAAQLMQRNSACDDLPAITDHVKKVQRPLIKRFYRATVTATGSVSKTVKVQRNGESVSDGADIPVLVAYTSSTFNAAGGPAAGHDVLIVETTPNNPVILGRVQA